MNDDLRVHTAPDGVVWCGQNGISARCTGFSPEEFITQSVFKTASVIRALGTPDNSRLLLEMYERHRNAPALARRQILIASPNLCPVRSLVQDPEEVLRRIWQPDVTARIAANWHSMGPVNFNAHMLELSVRSNKEITEKSRTIFRYHPVFSVLSFFEQVDVDFVIRLVCLIIDPRWFINTERPNRLSKVMRFSGLTPANFSESDDSWGRYRDRSLLVRGSWCVDDIPDIDAPRNFVWRILEHHGGSSTGMLKASQSFLRFLVLHWMQELRSSKRPLFDPVLFFKTEAEVAAYNEYASRARS